MADVARHPATLQPRAGLIERDQRPPFTKANALAVHADDCEPPSPGHGAHPYRKDSHSGMPGLKPDRAGGRQQMIVGACQRPPTRRNNNLGAPLFLARHA